jgi:pyruvate/2-oxoglutarate dehydrogenase complex dihydrolipoamide acyltransferase (E2) component
VGSSHTEPGTTAQALVDVAMPQMGVSVAEGTIVKWHKQPGDWVEADETVCEISTDKIDTELPSPATGRLARILVDENTTVGVGTPLAQIDTGSQPGQAHMRRRRRVRSRPPAARTTASRTAPASSLRWSAASRTSTASTCPR